MLQRAFLSTQKPSRERKRRGCSSQLLALVLVGLGRRSLELLPVIVVQWWRVRLRLLQLMLPEEVLLLLLLLLMAAVEVLFATRLLRWRTRREWWPASRRGEGECGRERRRRRDRGHAAVANVIAAGLHEVLVAMGVGR